jgi:hypothetical protein
MLHTMLAEFSDVLGAKRDFPPGTLTRPPN